MVYTFGVITCRDGLVVLDFIVCWLVLGLVVFMICWFVCWIGVLFAF